MMKGEKQNRRGINRNGYVGPEGSYEHELGK